MIDNARTGQNISAHRQRLGWTQGELARRLNVTHQAVSKWENGVAFPDISTLFALSQLFGVTMEQLLTGEYCASPDNAQNDSLLTEEASCAAPTTAVQLPLPDKPEAASEAPHETSAASDEENPSTLEAVHNGDAPVYDWDEIIALAPFASRNALDHLVSQCETACDREHIHALAPFISRDTLDRLIRADSDRADWDEIIALAPFASRETLDRLVSQCEASCDRGHIHALAPFLGRETLDRLILNSVRIKAPDKPNEDKLAVISEAHEKSYEQEARRAERIARRMERKMRKQAEKFSQELSQKAEQIHSSFSASGADVLKAFSPFLEKHLGEETVDQLVDLAGHAADDRRTQIAPAHPQAASLEEYADYIVSMLYETCEATDPIIGRFEEIRRAIQAQDYAALNEFASLLDEHIGPQWLEEYAELCGTDGEIPENFSQQLNLAVTQRDWNWIEDHAHLISDRDMIRRIALVSSSEGFFEFIPLFIDSLDQHSIDYAARQALRLNRTDAILSFADRVSPGIL